MSRHPIGIILNGVTGRMGYRQHLVLSLLAIKFHLFVLVPVPFLVRREFRLIGGMILGSAGLLAVSNAARSASPFGAAALTALMA